MEEYLQYMKTLRSHMIDVEDQAAKTSAEEQMQTTTIETLRKEIELAKSNTKRFKEDADLMMKAKGNICSQILERQRKNALLENDSSTNSQTLELIHQERANVSTKLVDTRTSYGKTEEEISSSLNEQKEWLSSYKSSSLDDKFRLVNIQVDSRAIKSAGNYDAKILVSSGTLDDAYKNTMAKIDAAKAKFDTLTQMRSELTLDRHKVKQSLEELRHRMDNFKPELRDMASETLEEELQALMSDKDGETEFQESLQNQISSIKGISDTINCGCGEVYKVEVDLCV